MATTPFSQTAVTFAGQGLPRDKSYSARARQFWLGRPGNMIQLPAPSRSYPTSPSRGEVVHALPGGGTSVTYFAFQKRTWQYAWKKLINRDWQILDGFHMRLFGVGPWCFPDPADVNYLPLGASMCGALNAVVEGWVATVGTIGYDPTQTPAEAPSGVLRWTGAGNGSFAAIGQLLAGVITANTSLGFPVIPALPTCPSVWVAKASGTVSARAKLFGIDATGAIVATINGTSTVLTTTPQELAAPTAAGTGSTAIYWVLGLECLTATSPDLLISNPQLEYTSSPSAWAAGSSVPRVVLTAFDAPVNGMGDRDVTATLATI